ncbi:serine/threonine protein kinase [Amycolatopsis thailandensis]|uniref:non-specific serine/threonine protein kinase n=1 Tax=Amycolatopsis thailandensis TaxID=589330 RepID=A0A229S8F3_9PSEU|nr:serine/threonine-protein kinase [Amycolatopsis thailandensis]OXM54864.1 serine/threonine protein kinase [Amycolatopsis thailandensis]
MSDEGRLVAGRYRIVQRIGTGAMGAVWQAHDEVLGRTVAIKQLLLQPGLEAQGAEDARQRTMREGRIAARLHHPNAISVFDVVTDDNGQPCLIMEYLNSTSLAQVLQEERTLPPTEVARIGAQVAAALTEAHAVGIVHRDIKPGNILLAPNGTVKITDFGISRAKDDVTVTKTGMIAGTPAYLAPEVAIGGDPGPESDVFSLGSTLYAACEGQPPFGLSENTLSLLHAVAAGQIIPPRQSGPLASVLAVLLHPEVRHRPTAEECEELLAAVARGETPLGGPADDTMLAAPVAGALAGGLAGAGVTQALDSESAGHSGSLLDDQAAAGPYYDDEDDYHQPPASRYPEDDYDGYDNYDETALLSERGHPGGGPAPTRAVPIPAGGYDDDPYDDDYDDQPPPPPPPPTRAQTSPVDEDDDEKPGAWKKPAIIGGVVVVALAALGFWLLSPNNPEAPAQVGNSSTKPSPSPTSSAAETTEPPSETQSAEPPKETSSSKKTSSKATQTQEPDPPTPTRTPTKTTPTKTPSSSAPSPTKSESEPTSPPATP